MLLPILVFFCFVAGAQTPAPDSMRVAFLVADSAHIADSMAVAMVNSYGKIGYVNDFEHIINNKTKKALTDLIIKHENKTTNQVSIFTVSDVGVFNADLEAYSIWLANYLGVGQKGKNNGVLVVVSKALRKVRISTGLGIENKLTDTQCKRIIDDLMIPEFKKGDFSSGILNGVNEIIRILE